jgi:phage tail sheath gpL-like
MVPGAYAEVDPVVASQGPGVFPLQALIIGQKTSAGTVTALTLTPTTSVEQAREEHGPGSIGHLLAKDWFSQGGGVALDMICQDDASGTPAASTHVVTGTITAPGAVLIYVAGERISITVSTDASTAAGQIRTALQALPDLPVTVTGAGANIILTANNDGTAGNYIDIRYNHLPGEAFPGALAITNPVMTSGATDPVVSAVFAAIAGKRYDVIVSAFTDTTSLNLIQTELEARAVALVGHPGMHFSATANIHGSLVSQGDARNNKFEVLIGMEVQPVWPQMRAAGVAAQAAILLQEDPVRPLTGRKLLAGQGPAESDKFTTAERDLLLHDGISTLRYQAGNRATIERLITTYQETSGGSPDTAFLDVQTAFGLAFLRRSYVAHFDIQFASHKLAANGTPIGPGSVTVTPEIAKADAVAWYSAQVTEGVAEDLEGFKTNTTFQIASADPNRLEGFLAVNLQNQLRVSATLFQFAR